jgi:two-component sensor histidine kinase/PAS domain-containing protein
MKNRLTRAPEASDYAFALGAIGVAVLCRAAVEPAVPGSVYFVTLFPAIALAGVFWGTRPAAIAAAVGGAAIGLMFFGKALLTWPPDGRYQVDMLMFAVAAGAIIWATSISRRLAAEAAAAEARLKEVFRQIPGTAVILEAPYGRLDLRSAQSTDVLQQPELPAANSDELSRLGGLHEDGSPLKADEYPVVRALKTGEVVRGELLRYRRPDGSLIDLEVHAGPVRGPDGAIVASVGMAFDVTDRVQAARRLRESEALYRSTAERLRAALDAGALGLWELDLATQRVQLDAALADMLKLPGACDMPAEALLGFADAEDRERVSRVFAAALAAGGVYSDELRVVTAGKARRWFIVRGTVLPADGKVVGVIGDVTERREREDALREALDARGVLMREADHRIKNSLQLVVSLLQLQLGRVADADAKVALRAAITRVTSVSDAHLALQQSPDLSSIELHQMLMMLCARVGSLNPAVLLDCGGACDVTLPAERAIPLGLIASELLTNALRHAFPPGAPGRVALRLNAGGGVVAVSIEDDGVGMPETGGRKGLGSVVVETLARQIGARVVTRSAAGRGTEVRVELGVGKEDSASF